MKTVNLVYFLTIILMASVSTTSAITITVGGNIEDKAVMIDHMTVDMCSYVYNCNNTTMTSIAGKNQGFTPGVFDNSKMKTAYAPRAQRANYAEYTEKSYWAVTGEDDSTKYSSAFSADSIYNRLADNSYHSVLAIGGDTAPAANQALVTLHSTGTVKTLRITDYYESADNAYGAVATSNAITYTGGYVFDNAKEGLKWEISVPGTY